MNLEPGMVLYDHFTSEKMYQVVEVRKANIVVRNLRSGVENPYTRGFVERNFVNDPDAKLGGMFGAEGDND